jgi:sarcosine oxidase, subunit gamma
VADIGPDTARINGFASLGTERPAGNLVAYAMPRAGQAAIRGSAGEATFMAAVSAALGAGLPMESRAAFTDGPLSIMRLGPDNWFAVHDTDAEFGLRVEQTNGFHGINLSSSRARLRIEGDAARDLFSVGSRLDLRSHTFPSGAFAQMPIGNATAILHCRDADAFDVYIARSFAESWLVWLRHAGLEFGLITA